MKPEDSKNIWIVVVTYNAEKWIYSCLNSVFQSSVISNIVVVDNFSTDCTIDILTKHYPKIKTIANKTNYGFGVGNNIGIQYALKNGAEYIVLLNQDAKLHVDTIEKLYSYAQQYPEYGILSPMFYSYEGTKLDLYLLNWILNYNLSLASDLYFKRLEDVYDVNLIPAAMWFIRKEALEEAGGFDPLFFMYGEDYDLWERFKARGWKTGFFPKTFVYHHTSENNYNIQKRIWHGYAAHINSLKNHKRSYFTNILFLFKKYIMNSLNAVIYWNQSELYVTQVVFFRAILRLNTIYKNRRLSVKEKMPFLN